MTIARVCASDNGDLLRREALVHETALTGVAGIVREIIELSGGVFGRKPSPEQNKSGCRGTWTMSAGG